MSKHDKNLAKLRATPPPSDFKWDDLVTVLKKLGYKQLNNSGARRKFFHEEKSLLIACHQPHPSPNVDKGCIVDVVEHLKTNGVI